LADSGKIELPTIPEDCEHNAHMFYIKVKDLEERTALQQYLRDQGIQTAFHYIPLHSAPAGERFGYFHGEDCYTTKESERLVRMPMYYYMDGSDIEEIIKRLYYYYYYDLAIK